MRGLSGKRVLVVGGAAGIGKATALRLAREGSAVAIGDFDLEGAEAVRREVEEHGGTAFSIWFDLNDAASLERLVNQAAADLGGLDGVANIAADTRAKGGPDVDVSKMDPATWENTLRANLTSYALVIQHALSHLLSSGAGSIVNTTSDSAKIGETVRPAYAASKAGINTLTRHVASTWGKSGIRCNSVSPGLVMTETAKAVLDDEFQRNVLEGVPLPRLGKPEDLAATIAFLLSDDAEWITGQVWAVNGGGGYRD